MTSVYHHESSPFAAGTGFSWARKDGQCRGMGRCRKDSFEDLVSNNKTSCPMIDLAGPAKMATPARAEPGQHDPAPSSSETGDCRCVDHSGEVVVSVVVAASSSTAADGVPPDTCDGCDDGTHGDNSTNASITASNDISTAATYNSNNNNVTEKDIQDMESAKAAVTFMGVPKEVVELVIALEPNEPARLQFRTTEELYLRTQEVLGDPQWQSQLFRKLSQLRQGQSQGQSESQGQSTTQGQGQSRDQGWRGAAWSSAGEDSPTGMSEGPRQPATAPAATTSSSAAPTPTAGTTLLADGFTSSATFAIPSSIPSAVTSVGVSGELQSETAEPPPARRNDDQEKEAHRPGQESVPQAQASSSARDRLRRKLAALSRENRRLKQRQVCRTCRVTKLSEDGQTFLPCGHFITCTACSKDHVNCPACGKAIMGTVQTFLS